MKLKDDFFKVKTFCQTTTGMDFTIELNPEHTIFEAHFPNNPITPGVYIIQIVKELSQEMLKRELLLKNAKNIKFLNVINPIENKEVTVSISFSSESEGEYKIGSVVFSGEKQFSKLSMIFINNE
jgi:3-hydroxyacyl-[acyl-carrier-protein] dehydratase